MLLLLPPSEGKTAPDAGAPLSLERLSIPALTEHRSRVLDALIGASSRPDAATLLGVGPGLVAEVERNRRLRCEPAAPAALVYTGVLHAAAGLGSLSTGQARRAAERVRIASALWGFLSPADPIPAYRLSMGVDLPGVGPLARSWRPQLATAMDATASGQLVVDCRSSAYLNAWRPAEPATSWVVVRVLREQDGRRSIVSHPAKHTRGLLTRHLVTRADRDPASPAELLEVARELVGTVVLDAELAPSAAPGRPAVLTLVVTGAPGARGTRQTEGPQITG